MEAKSGAMEDEAKLDYKLSGDDSIAYRPLGSPEEVFHVLLPACVFAHRHNNDDDDDGGDDDYDDDDDNDDDVRPERKRIILKQKNTDVSRRGVTRSS
ncbi:hypothetical protein HZH66_013600 [Vespula vulgaris]|uniref:Uncharacterized protein n=1 Tax=Vespula vulgaris TaxID=7454 RepID=A0A834J5A6_VESVU|nr:hypothetical protein HZH66_013600 [Vespula vulgaris]